MPRPKTKKKIEALVEMGRPTELLAEIKMTELATLPIIDRTELDKVDKVSYVLYEAKVDGKSRFYPATTAVPRMGKLYGIRTFEDDDRSRILISQKDYNESFTFSDGPVVTKYGFDSGKTCIVTIKLVDVMLDVATERVIGVYLVIMTPSFAQVDVDAVKFMKEVEQKDISKIKEEALTHESLMLKFQLSEALKQSETYRRALFNRDTNVIELAEDFAAPIIETTISALAATRDMFDLYTKSKEGNWIEENWKLIVGLTIFSFLTMLVYFLGPWAGG